MRTVNFIKFGFKNTSFKEKNCIYRLYKSHNIYFHMNVLPCHICFLVKHSIFHFYKRNTSLILIPVVLHKIKIIHVIVHYFLSPLRHNHMQTMPYLYLISHCPIFFKKVDPLRFYQYRLNYQNCHLNKSSTFYKSKGFYICSKTTYHL